jgi:hypothetical protein
MQIEFPFVREKANIVKSILRPLARVIFNEEVPQWMYVDSGADVTLLPRSVGELLGFEIYKGEEIKEVKGLGNSRIPIVVRRVSMKIGDKEFEARVAWSLTEDVPLVLGRLDVFNKFDILFKEREEKVVFIS